MKRNRLTLGVVLALVAMLFTASASAAQSKDKKSGKSATAAKAAETKAELIDINTATKAELTALPGIGEVYSQKIIDGRPYTRKDQLVSKKIIPQGTYDKIKDQIIAKQSTEKKK